MAIQRSWPALSDWICEELYCSGLRIPLGFEYKTIWGSGRLEASDDDYYRLHEASEDSEPVDPFDNKEFLVNSGSKIASHMIRFGIHQYVTKKNSGPAKEESKKNGAEERVKKEKPSSKKRKSDSKEKSRENEKSGERMRIREERTREEGAGEEKINGKEELRDEVRSDTKQEVSKKKRKRWWYKFIDRQSKKKREQETSAEKPIPESKVNNYEYLLFGSGPGDQSNITTPGTQQIRRRLYIQEFVEDHSMGSNFPGNKMRPETYVPLEIKTSIFAAYFAAEPVLIHFSKTISRNRRVRYGQEIAVAEAFPRTVNNSLSNIILARCDGTISIITQTKGVPIQSTRMFLVITCNDTPF
ncbi:hypothetical protein HWI79_1757 [Cryptosporidium felis]|nr:hypothetical protein HWI79_1757 [Cryptosporidium felis]